MSSVDSFFLLGADDRRRFLRIAGRFLGCAYACSWCPHIYHARAPARHFFSPEGWHQLEEDGSSSSSSGIISLRLFDAYRGSLCSIQDGCFPGLAYMGGITYVEIREPDLINLASMDVQRQFYQEAGIKAAVFVGSRSGEIELGMMMPPSMNMQMNLQQVFSPDFIQSQFRENLIDYNSQLGGGGGGGGGGDLLAPQQHERSHLSSSSSSLRSLSLGSPDTSSPRLFPATTSCSLAPEAPFSQLYNFTIPTDHHDEAMTRALMLAVVSSTTTATASSSSTPALSRSPPLMAYPLLLQQQAYQGGGRWRLGDHGGGGAFRVYSQSMVSPKLEADNLNKPGQRMIKKGIDILRRINMMRLETQMQEQYRPASSAQLHHMISERRRREKLNENLHALRLLLPPGSKKDKTSVLASTRNYLNSLKARIKELEERNQMLETQLQGTAVEAGGDERDDVSGSNERVQVRISHGASVSTSEGRRRVIILKLLVREEELEMMDFAVHVLGCLQQMKDDRHEITLLSMNASSTSSPPNNAFGRANLTLQIKGAGSDWDEETFKEVVRKAVNDVLDVRRRRGGANNAGPSS